MGSFKLVIAGVGGQGTLLASRLLAQSAIEAGLHVTIGETYGMAQRGGPVMSHVHIGGETNNPQMRPGEADVLLGFEIGEAIRRGVTYLKDGGLVLVNRRKLPPVEVISGLVAYPSEESLISLLKQVTEDIVIFDATRLANKAGDPITTNVVMLGALTESGRLPFSKDMIVTAMKSSLRHAYLELNMRAFDLGKKGFRQASEKGL